MNTSFLIFAFLVGWCGTRWPRWWPPGPTPPEPDPEPWWKTTAIGAVGGLIGGVLVGQVFQAEFSLVTVAIGAFVGGRVLTDLYGLSGIGNESNKQL